MAAAELARESPDKNHHRDEVDMRFESKELGNYGRGDVKGRPLRDKGKIGIGWRGSVCSNVSIPVNRKSM
jgi:hypothetical protein